MVENLPKIETSDGEISEKDEGPVLGVIEKIEIQVENPTDTTAIVNNSQQNIVTVPNPTFVNQAIPDDAVILPATQSSFVAGETSDVKSSLTWLRTWCEFMIKKYGSKVFFKGE